MIASSNAPFITMALNLPAARVRVKKPLKAKPPLPHSSNYGRKGTHSNLRATNNASQLADLTHLTYLTFLSPLFNKHQKLFFGVIHLRPLPSSPRWQGNLEKVIAAAIADARAYARGGAHAVFIENFGDVPFTKTNVGPETVAAMSAAGRAIRAAVKLPIGFNVLRNDARAALALCAACNGSFIRVNVHTGAMLTDQGLIEGHAYDTLRHRQQLCPQVKVFADVHVKHAVPLGNWSLADSARDTIERGLADALIVSGVGTGLAANLSDVEQVRRACPSAKILLGSGVTLANIRDFLPLADGFIVGTSVKREGNISNPVDPKRVRALVSAIAI
jgi:membrane complex biogenesis BtpA family protein